MLCFDPSGWLDRKNFGASRALTVLGLYVVKGVVGEEDDVGDSESSGVGSSNEVKQARVRRASRCFFTYSLRRGLMIILLRDASLAMRMLASRDCLKGGDALNVWPNQHWYHPIRAIIHATQ